ncbi:MAG: hypothetical protein N2446_01650 [Elusimicrobiales bacterium]|nr:hypothetical protein [Elusimicrobiales bacterium]
MAIYKLLISLDESYNNKVYNSIYENVRKMGGVISIEVFNLSGVIKVIYDNTAVTYEKIISRILSFNVKIENYYIENEQHFKHSYKYNSLGFNKLIFLILFFLVFYYSDKFSTNKYLSFIIYFFLISWVSYDFILIGKQDKRYTKLYYITVLYFFSLFLYKLIIILFPNLSLDDFISWHIIAFFLLIISIGFHLFHYLLAKNEAYLENVRRFMPSFVNVVKKDRIEKVSIDDLIEDDIVIFKKGDFVCLDSFVVSGKAFVDESLINGKFGLVEKKEGSDVLSGSFVIDGEIQVKVLKRPKFSNFFNILSSLSKYYQKGVDFIYIPIIIFRKYLVYIPFVIFLIVFLSIKKYISFNVIESFFISFFIVYPSLIWLIFPILYMFCSISSVKKGFYIRNINSVIPIIFSNTIVFFSNKRIDLQTIRKLKENGFETVLISSFKDNKESNFDISYYEIPCVQKEGFIIKMKMKGKKIISVGYSVEDLVALSASDVSVITAFHPQLYSFNCDVVLLRDEPNIIVDLKKYSSFIYNIIKQNSYLVILFNFLILPSILVLINMNGIFLPIDNLVFYLTMFIFFIIVINSVRIYLFFKN